jgi:two-component system, chemotaxis family, chemotaxis protein CheY
MGRRILVVDDSVVAAQQITAVLQAVGCEVVGHAKNGAEGLTLYNRLRPDLVMMDLVMPMMDGLQALRALRGLNAEVKVIVLSSLGGVESKATEALRMGAVAVVTKPIEAASVSQAVERALEGRV